MPKELNIGWALSGDKHKIIFNDPKRTLANKDKSLNGKGYLSCPAVRSFLDNQFYNPSPYAIRLRFKDYSERFEIHPVYPFTSINENILKDFLFIEHPSSWREKHLITIQMPSPYVFFSDDPCFIEQSHPLLLNQTSLNWRLIPGKFDIYSWQRPLNWAFEWDIRSGDLIIQEGEPLYIVRFFSEKFKESTKVSLKKYEMNDKIKKRLELTHEITKVKKGINPLIQKAKIDRKKIKLLK